MNLADLTLDLADFSIGIQEHVATNYADATGAITAAGLEGQTGTFGGGTLWYYDDDGKCHMTGIERQSGNVIFPADKPDEAPVQVFIAPAKPFRIHQLRSAVNQVLAIYPVMDINTDLDIINAQRAYTLPTGVSDIRRVEYPSGSDYEISHYWRVIGRELEFYNTAPTTNDNPLRIHHVINHGRVSGEDVSNDLNLEYIRYIAYLNLYRQQLTSRHKDNTIAGDIYNEGKMYEQILRDRHAGKLNLLTRDFTYAPI